MQSKPLALTNPHLRDARSARRRRIRSLASSTAIETGESIASIERKLTRLLAKPIRVTLA